MKIKFNKIILIIFGILISFILILIFLNLNISAKVKDINIKGEAANADITNQIIEIKFTHLSDKKSIENNLTFIPSTPLNLNWKDNKTLKIVFNEPLKSNTEYSLNIQPSDKGLKSNYKYNFTTKKMIITYIEKENSLLSTKIIESDQLFENKKTLFEMPNIKAFSRNKYYLAAIVQNESKTNDIYIVNLKDNSTNRLNIENSLISTLSLSPVENKLVFNQSPAVKAGSEPVPSQSYFLNLYDLEKNELTQVNPENTANYILFAAFSPDGSSIIYKTDASLYYITDTATQKDLLSLGKHSVYSGFNYEKNKILFNNVVTLSPTIQIYNSNRQIYTLSDTQQYIIDPVFGNNSEEIFYAEKIESENPTDINYEIKYLKNINSLPVSILKEEGKSLEIPKISPDDRYLLIERFEFNKKSSTKDFRFIGFQIRPGVSELILYDRIENKVIDPGIKGLEAIWGIY